MIKPLSVVTVALLILLISLPTLSGIGQRNYVPLKNDSAAIRSLLEKATLKFQADKKGIDGPNKKYVIKEYQDRFEHVKEMFEKAEVVTGKPARTYLESLAERILSANPALQELHPSILFSKMYWPNAASYGEGTIVFNIGLFNRLRNESQAAFILCHELAHYYLQHSNKAIDNYVNTLYSKEFQGQLREIKKSEYQQGKSLDELVKNISYKSRRHSRDHESAADSMALELLRPTGFDVREALSCLALLDSVDTEKYAGNLHLSEQFNFPDYPFRRSWLRQSSPTLDEAIRASEAGKEAADAEADSLKTHPDCSARILRLTPRAEAYYNGSQQLFPVSKPLFDTLVRSFDYELIECCYQSDKAGRALYYALQQFYKEKDNLYLATMIGRCLNRIYRAQKEHTFSKVVDINTSSDSEEYETFLKFLRNLKLDDIASISYYFMKQHTPEFGSNKDFEAVYKESVGLFSSQ